MELQDRQEYFIQAPANATSRYCSFDLSSANFTTAYKVMLQRRLENLDFTGRAQRPIDAFKDRTGRTVTPARLWSSAKTQSRIRKSGDLLCCLLHGKVMTGRTMHWIPATWQEYPIHACDLSLIHVFLGCDVPGEVWGECKDIWEYLTGVPFILPYSIDEIIAFMALPRPGCNKIDKRRWQVQVQTAIWAI